MIAWLRNFLRSRVLTPAEVKRLNTTDTEVFSRLTTPGERQLLEALRAPERWQPDQPLTPTEEQSWGAVLRSPLLLKIDVAMINLAQLAAARACASEPKDLVKQAGYAVGWREAWQTAKSLSTLASADAGKSEQTGETAPDPLEHLQP